MIYPSSCNLHCCNACPCFYALVGEIKLIYLLFTDLFTKGTDVWCSSDSKLLLRHLSHAMAKLLRHLSHAMAKLLRHLSHAMAKLLRHRCGNAVFLHIYFFQCTCLNYPNNHIYDRNIKYICVPHGKRCEDPTFIRYLDL